MPNPRRNHPSLAFAGLLSVLCAFWLAPALHAEEAEIMASPKAPVMTEDSDSLGQTRFAPTRRRAVSPFAASLRACEQAHAEAMAGLRAELDLAPRSERAGVQRRIEALKLTREARLVALQLGEAQRKGDTSLAAKLTRRLSRLSASGASLPVIPVGGER